MAALASKPCDELKPGTVSVSSKFPLPGSIPERILFPAGTMHDDPVYIYRMPAAAAEKDCGPNSPCIAIRVW